MITTQPQIEEQALEWFVRLSDVDAPASFWMSFQDWLEADDAHRLAYDDIERTWVELDLVSPVEAVPARLGSAEVTILPVAANDEDLRPAARGARRRPVWLLPSFAAAAAVAVVVGAWPQISGSGPVQTYHTDFEPRTVVLSDGSRVVMNRHSDLTVRMGRNERAVTLAEGEAAFDVTHSPDRPFTIAAGDHSVRVLGTAFNVLNHGDRFAVSVERGIVAVTPAATADAPRPAAVRLTAGQKIDQSGARSPTLSQVDPDRASIWRQGMLVYRDAGLSDVADDLSRYFDKPVTVDASAGALHFTGALQVGDEATMLKQLQDFVPVRATRSSTDVRLSGRDAR
jgi:transmembrane sensor